MRILLLLLLGLVACTERGPHAPSSIHNALDDTLATLPSPTVPATPRLVAQPLLGTWQSTVDPRYRIRIAPEKFSEYYDGKLQSESPMTLDSDCNAEGDPAPTTSYFSVGSDEEAICYLISEVTDTTLRYIYVGRGNTLSFRRVAE